LELLEIIPYEKLSIPEVENNVIVNILEPISSMFPTTVDENYKHHTFYHTTQNNQTEYNITFQEDTICDVLIVGGGGGGDGQIGGGGGGGVVFYTQEVLIPADNYIINVGSGGTHNILGGDTTGFGVICKAGGSTLRVAWSAVNQGLAGGSGSGGSSATGNSNGGGVGISTKGSILASGTLYNGNIGGNGSTQAGSTIGSIVASGGGGGAGTAGKNSNNTVRYTNMTNLPVWIDGGTPSAGGDGVIVNILGIDYYWGGGGGGGSFRTLAGTGGLGGGDGGSQAEGTTSQLGGAGGIDSGLSGFNNANGGEFWSFRF